MNLRIRQSRRKVVKPTKDVATPVKKTETSGGPFDTVQLSPRGGLDRGDWGILLTIYANGLAEGKDRDIWTAKIKPLFDSTPPNGHPASQVPAL